MHKAYRVSMRHLLELTRQLNELGVKWHLAKPGEQVSWKPEREDSRPIFVNDTLGIGAIRIRTCKRCHKKLEKLNIKGEVNLSELPVCADCRSARSASAQMAVAMGQTAPKKDWETANIDVLDLPESIRNSLPLYWTVKDLREAAKGFQLRHFKGIGQERAAIIADKLADYWRATHE